MEGIRYGSRPVVLLVVLLALAGCGSPNQPRGPSDNTAAVEDPDPDAVVGAAVEEVLGDTSFRSRTAGEIPFLENSETVYEQSGDDVFTVWESNGLGSATVISGHTVYEWDQSAGGWRENPLESFDPLVAPGLNPGVTALGLLDLSGDTDTDREGRSEQPPIATGWTEIGNAADGSRRFERTLPSELFAEPVDEEGDPIEHRQESAIVNAFFRLARVTSEVEVDFEGHLKRNIIRVVFDGDPDHPNCSPMARYVGVTEMVAEFTDVGADFAIKVPDPASLVADYPVLGEQPDLSTFHNQQLDTVFRNEAGDRDFAGCPSR